MESDIANQGPHQKASGSVAPPVRVLVLDDEENIRRLLKMTLMREGFEVDTASNGRQGLQLLLTKTFDVVVVDLRMQEMDGIAFIQEARKIWPWQRFVIYSGFIDDQSVAIAKKEGIEQILTKPLDMKRLIDAVLQEAKRRNTRNQTGARLLPMDVISYQLNIMRHISREVIHSQNLLSGLILLGQSINEFLPYDVLGILVVEDEEKLILLQHSQSQPDIIFTRLRTYMIERYQALSGRYLDSESLRTERTGPPSLPDDGRELKNILSVPVITGEQVHGILTFASFHDQAFDELNVALLYHAASNLSTLFTAINKMRQMATRDPLTGLYNRRQMEDELDRMWRLSNRHNQSMAVLILDMDQLKQINDQWGHQAGDQVIREFAAILKSQTRITDILARYGGDEFIILISQVRESEVAILAERILESLRKARLVKEKGGMVITASIGIAVYQPGRKVENHRELLACADQALYRAKTEGRDRYAFWSDKGAEETGSPAAVQDQARKASILVLDDEEYVLMIVRTILGNAGFSVTTARTITEAVGYLKNRERHFDILLCDLSLPDGDGMDVLRQARESDGNMVNIVISGNVTADNAISALRNGAYDFIQKPIIAETLLALVNRALQYRNLLRENTRYRDYLEEMVRAKKTELSRALEDIKLAYEFTLETMVAMLDAREFETGQHSVRVRDLTMLLAGRMGFEGEQLEEIGRGALLHDIGKIGIPDAILLKPGKLTEDEWEVMRTHPDIGYRFLKNSVFLQTAAGVVWSHHERWDGQGYPQRLKGGEINIGARIFAVIDAYDAMRSTRVYKKSIGAAEAIEEIRKHAGTQFDPAVVEAFLKCIDEIEKIGCWSNSFG